MLARLEGEEKSRRPRLEGSSVLARLEGEEKSRRRVAEVPLGATAEGGALNPLALVRRLRGRGRASAARSAHSAQERTSRQALVSLVPLVRSCEEEKGAALELTP